ncbi:hypothetical protein VTK26DRAFT_8011 [Humicola hyalothermophila]
MSSYSSHPHFTDPWHSSSTPTGPGPQSGSQQHSLYVGSQSGAALPHLNLGPLPKHPQHSQASQHAQHPQHPQHPQHGASRTASSTSMAPYGSLPVTAPSAGSPPVPGVYRQHGLLPVSQDLLSLNRLQHPSTSAAYDTSAYTTAASPVSQSYAPSPTTYDQLSYGPAHMRGPFSLGPEDSARRFSQHSLHTDDRRSFQEALEASHGMLSMSQETPRNIYDVRSRQQRGSADSYGFPPTHSATSSISSTGFSGYYGGSVDGSVSDYSTTGSDMESMSGRTLPRPQGLMSSQPPAPQSMMGSFSSKVSSSTQKKHKCKVCDKRFTRPSSLQTHMYSHTGEKPFACEVEGCGRNFSVVSNLRRHRKVHKNQTQAETPSEAGSEDHQSE